MNIDSLAVIGLGYVGLPLAVAMAGAGRRVTEITASGEHPEPGRASE